MRKPRTNILLLMTILILAGVVGQAWLADQPVAGDLPAQVAAGTVRTNPPVPVIGTSAPARVLPAASAPVARVETLSDEASGLVAEMCDLQLLADGTGLELDSEQWTALASAVRHAQAARHNYEARIAVSQPLASGRYRMEIPAYAVAGEVLREQFAAELSDSLGENTAVEVLARLGERLEGRFAGFGVSEQTLDITGDPARDPHGVQVARTASYWSGMGGDRVATRREIIFPAVEDPTGTSWSALLAVAAAKS